MYENSTFLLQKKRYYLDTSSINLKSMNSNWTILVLYPFFFVSLLNVLSKESELKTCLFGLLSECCKNAVAVGSLRAQVR